MYVCGSSIYPSVLPPAEAGTQKQKEQENGLRRASGVGRSAPCAGGAQVGDGGPL